jgi:hypothetical protein
MAAALLAAAAVAKGDGDRVRALLEFDPLSAGVTPARRREFGRESGSSHSPP